MGYVELSEAAVEGMGVGGRHDVVRCSVQDESWREVFRSLCGKGLNEACGDFYDGAKAAAFLKIVRRGKACGEGQGEKASEGDAGEDDAVGVDAGALCDELNGSVDGGQPLGGVSAALDGREVRVGRVGEVEVVGSVEGEVGVFQEWGEARGPEVQVATGSVQEHDGGVFGRGTAGCVGFLGEEADRDGVDLK